MKNKTLQMNLQKFAGKTNVFPVSDNTFKVGKDKSTATTIADMETFSPSLSNGVETWTPMDAEGWQRALMTAKAMTITLSGKRNIGDTGNDYVAAFQEAVWNMQDSMEEEDNTAEEDTTDETQE